MEIGAYSWGICFAEEKDNVDDGTPKKIKRHYQRRGCTNMYIKYKIALLVRCLECAKGIHPVSHSHFCRHGHSDQSHVSKQSINKSNSITTTSLLACLSTAHKPRHIPRSIHPCDPIISTGLIPCFPTHLLLPSQNIDHRSCEREKAISVSIVPRSLPWYKV